MKFILTSAAVASVASLSSAAYDCTSGLNSNKQRICEAVAPCLDAIGFDSWPANKCGDLSGDLCNVDCNENDFRLQTDCKSGNFKEIKITGNDVSHLVYDQAAWETCYSNVLGLESSDGFNSLNFKDVVVIPFADACKAGCADLGCKFDGSVVTDAAATYGLTVGDFNNNFDTWVDGWGLCESVLATDAPTSSPPTDAPTAMSDSPTAAPTTLSPTQPGETRAPSAAPTLEPTMMPTYHWNMTNSTNGTTWEPTSGPTAAPTVDTEGREPTVGPTSGAQGLVSSMLFLFAALVAGH